jgi:hypothetical protein
MRGPNPLARLVDVVQVTELADHISPQELGHLLFVGLRISSPKALHVLMQMPAAQQVEQQVIWEVLEDALKTRDRNAQNAEVSHHYVVMGHPAVRSLPACLVEELKREEVEGECKLLDALDRLQPTIDVEALEELLVMGEEEGGLLYMVSAICQLWEQWMGFFGKQWKSFFGK